MAKPKPHDFSPLVPDLPAEENISNILSFKLSGIPTPSLRIDTITDY